MKNLISSFLFLAVAFYLSACGIQSIPQQQNEVDAAWANVLNQYQRRADLIPNLVEVVKGYAKHEQDTLQKVVEARAAATQIRVEAKDLTDENLAQFQKAQGQLTGALSR
jgi:LemA protein